MTTLDLLDRLWPYMAALSTGGLVPLVIWYGRRWDRRDQAMLGHEERRTQAIESIPAKISALGETMRSALAEQHREVMSAIDRSNDEIIKAIEQDRLADIRRALQSKASPNGTS